MTDRTIGVGLVGYGLAGASFHAPLIGAVAGLRLAAVVTSRQDEVAAGWPEARAVEEAGALFADPEIELVVIATPNLTHAPLARAALEAGKHVVIDKPFATDAAEGETLIALAAERGRMLSVFHNRRWDGDYLTVHRLLAEKRLGEISLFEAQWDKFRPAIKTGWREVSAPGSGLLADLGPHLIDQVLQLFGRPDALSADVLTQRAAAETDDYFEVTLHYGTMRAIVSASTLMIVPRPRFRLAGSAGLFEKYGLDPQETWMRAGQRPQDAGFGEDAPGTYGVLTDPKGVATTVPTEPGDYRCFYEGVAAAILHGTPPPVDPADACTGLRLIELARVSAATGRQITL
ncbi:oxidoreductase [Glacieibacterium sp.]|uniref:oxidoreductase n=1 Tax=Glacieibacterium sp. TaxID=2860237 RepID=UPI003B00682B